MTVRIKSASFWMLFGLACVSFAQEPQSQQPTFSITISTAQAMVKVGSPVRLTIVVKNTSDHDIPWGTVPGIREVDVKAWDQDGKPVSETERGQKVHGRHRDTMITTAFGFPIKPGESIKEHGDLDKEFDLSKPGKYTVQAERRQGGTEVFVKSNKITFTVTP